MTDLVSRAVAFATAAHEGQKRKYTGEPYIVHPMEVMGIMAEHGQDDVTQAMAVLHDVIEDCGVTRGEIEAEFGAEVAEGVAGLTDVSRPEDGNRRERKLIDLEHIRRGCRRVHTVKAGDLISNTKSIVGYDASFARVYLVEKRAVLDVIERCDPSVLARARDVLSKAEMDIALLPPGMKGTEA